MFFRCNNHQPIAWWLLQREKVKGRRMECPSADQSLAGETRI